MTTTQLIDANGAVVAALPEQTNPAVSDYNVVAVVGCQSGGKSTLLNFVFGTSFPVLDAPTSGRRRTTLGVWGAIAPPSPDTSQLSTVVLDIEGTDSRERGEGARSFESRTTLFALALSDVVLVNMWAHDLGRHTAANYDLFETVFAHAVALRRAQSQSRPRPPVSVIIVVRDHDGESLVSDIRRVLMADLNNIWDRLRIRSFSLSDLFDIDVVTLPHKLYDPEGFVQDTAKLRDRVDKEARSRTARAPVPLDGFNALARTVWNGVCSCTGGSESASTLDLPRHASLAAYYRLGQAVDTMLSDDITPQVDELRTEIEMQWQRPTERFSARVEKIAKDAFARFDDVAAPYRNAPGAGDAPTRRRAELGNSLAKYVTELRERHLSVCRDFCMNGFEDKFRPMLGGTTGFERKARRLANSFIRQYRSLALEASMPNVLQPYVVLEEDDLYEDLAVNIDTRGASGQDPNSETMTDVVDEAYHEEVNQELGLIDSDEEDEDEFSVEKFRRDILAKVEERRQFGEVLLPGSGGIIEPKRDPWWKGLLIRGAILLINYLQATHGQRAALRLIRKHENEFPPAPSF